MIPPQEASARRREIEDKLKQEEETLSFIRDSLEKSDQLTKNMVSILSSFESRLMKLENSIIPVHKQTENLQRLQENVEKTLSCLDHVISYYHVASDTEKIIKEGPTGRLEEYLGSMAKIQKAVEYFQDNSPDSPELNKVKLLFERGKEALESEFRSLMTRHSKVVSPVLILDLVSGDDDLEAQEDVALEHLPESVLQDVIRISRWLVEYGRNQDFMNVYYQIRSSQLDRSIKGLKEHFHKSSSSSGVPYSPAIPNKRKDTPTKKPVKRPGHEHDFRVKHLSEALNDKHGPLAGEYRSPARGQPLTLPSQRSPDAGGSLVLPQGTARQHQEQAAWLITSMETIGAKALEDFADNIKNDPDKEYNMPKDGTVHELTSNAILFLQQLLDFQETAGAMLASQGTGTSQLGDMSFLRVLSTISAPFRVTLSLNLIHSTCLGQEPWIHPPGSPGLPALQSPLVAVTQKTAERSYREHIEQQIQTYQRSWLKVTDYIAEKNLPVFQPGVKLRDKERQVIKERFKGFNDGLEELCKIQKAWAIPDTEQRDRIRQAQKTIVKETYGAFLQNVPFTKNPEKYIKYGWSSGDMIDRLFDTSA
uniref:Exocyst complex component 7 n=1 Tax=Nomascus leucogenys TaxID=61853 RepID=A0A2I3GWS9_NOMLE